MDDVPDDLPDEALAELLKDEPGADDYQWRSGDIPPPPTPPGRWLAACLIWPCPADPDKRLEHGRRIGGMIDDLVVELTGCSNAHVELTDRHGVPLRVVGLINSNGQWVMISQDVDVVDGLILNEIGHRLRQQVRTWT